MSSRRNTQIDFFGIGAGEAPSQSAISSGYSSAPKADSTNKSSRKRARSPQGDTVNTEDAPRPSKLATVPESGISAHEELEIKRESPWKRYKKVYDRELGGPVTVATQIAHPFDLVVVRKFSEPEAEKTLYMFQQIQHNNFTTALKVFITETTFYVVHENFPISLDQIVASPPYPDELQLAAMVGQILDGIAYLTSKGFEHGSLSCSNILLSPEGDIKITNQECCRAVPRDAYPKDVRALGSIMMELMQKYTKDDGAVGVDDLRRWPSNSDAVGFLSATTSAASAGELKKHLFLNSPWQKETLKGIISLAQISKRPRYTYIQ